MVVIEEGETSWGAYVPDLPGCVAVGETEVEVKQLIQEAIEFHLETLTETGRAKFRHLCREANTSKCGPPKPVRVLYDGPTTSTYASSTAANSPTATPSSAPAVIKYVPFGDKENDTMTQAKNTICLWYDGDAEEAARFYAETFPDSAVDGGA